MEASECRDEKNPPFSAGDKIEPDARYFTGGPPGEWRAAAVEWRATLGAWVVKAEDCNGRCDFYWAYWFNRARAPRPALSPSQCHALLAVLVAIRPYVIDPSHDSTIADVLPILEECAKP